MKRLDEIEARLKAVELADAAGCDHEMSAFGECDLDDPEVVGCWPCRIRRELELDR